MLSNLLSGFLGAIVGGILTFFGSLRIFNKQRRHDERKVKIEKALELIYIIDQIERKIILDVSGGLFYILLSKNYYTKELITEMLDLYGRACVIYYYIFNKKFDPSKEIVCSISYFDSFNNGMENLLGDRIDNAQKDGQKAEATLKEVKKELQDFIK